MTHKVVICNFRLYVRSIEYIVQPNERVLYIGTLDKCKEYRH